MEIENATPFEVETLPFKGPEGAPVLTVIIKGTFDIIPDQPAKPSSEQVPVAYGDELYNEEDGGSVRFEADIAPFKPRADIALAGRAYAPHGQAVEWLDVSLRIGNLVKTITVVGDRRWKLGGRFSTPSATDPEPFTVMELVYERAFGGMDLTGGDWCKENPIGRGFFVKKSRETLDGAPLPNLEDPDNMIRSWDDHPKPVGYGFYGKMWAPRSGYLGTYDEKWRKERSPDPPEDFRFDFYNAAHPDLQVEGYLKGDETVELVNFTPEGRIRFQLSGIRLSIKVTKSGPAAGVPSTPTVTADTASASIDEESPAVIEEIHPNLDTLCFIPDEKRFYVLWRGLCPIKDLTAMEVRKVEITSAPAGMAHK